MPKETYNIGYSPKDFFYSTDSTEEKNKETLINETLNFNVSPLIEWCNSMIIAGTSVDISAGTPAIPDQTLIEKCNSVLAAGTAAGTAAGISLIPKDNLANVTIFDDRIINIVKQYPSKFIDEFLPGNLKISNKYQNIGVTFNGQFSSEDADGRLSKTNAKADVDFHTGSKLENIGMSGNYKTTTDGTLILNIDEIQTAMPDYPIDDGIIRDPQTGKPATPPVNNPAGKILLIASDINPRCKFQPTCTINHEHYAKCKTQLFSDKNGKTYCKCVCSGPISTDGKEHQHCSPYNVKNPGDPGYDEKIDGGYNDFMGFTGDGNNLTYSSFNNSVSNLKVELNGMFPAIKGDAASMIASYGDADNTNIEIDKNIRATVYDYYLEVYENKRLQKILLSNSSFDSTAMQSMKDANMAYKVKYLELFNIVSGIIMASGYIYIFAKKLPMFNKKIA